jgi:hypothetical protein
MNKNMPCHSENRNTRNWFRKRPKVKSQNRIISHSLSINPWKTYFVSDPDTEINEIRVLIIFLDHA